MEQQNSVYKKLNECRLKFMQAKVKKSGKNTFAGYEYFELDDILKAVIGICNEVGAVTIVNFTSEAATLNFTDCDSGQSIVFTSPMASASLKGCHEVQNLGAVESYIKRYLYQNCFEIAEPDSLDKTMNPNDTKQKPKQQQKAQSAPQQQELTEQQKAQNFENFIVSYANRNPKETFAILSRFGYENPKEVPADKRKEIADTIKKELNNG
jgi:chromosomal replication initiation ATPase DnaA